ncbi:SoxR reducing system RseC family protein [Thiomicrospira sp. R3]|uniref:SoxR reducing system RseC family protein n=1 Tax=Thiomicrospira sp. R3 TaxID=3035472 RepID=UPI00259B3FC9|nr:SoxR reducing system RseC family protein [Thiomicrospira sp. R3]WFE68629.1 SoxR reducing system RseC family protein [Thiomicrospira sp. R3]
MTQRLQAQGWVESTDQNHVWVRTQRESACGGCQGQSSCGTSSLAKVFAMGSQPLLRLPNLMEARPGDQVLLELDGSSLIKQAFLAYGLPLLGLFTGALLVNTMLLNPQDWQTAAGALLGMVVAWLWVRFNHRPEQPKIIQVIRSSV